MCEFRNVGQVASVLMSLLNHRLEKMKLDENLSSYFSFPGDFNPQGVLRTEVTLTFQMDPFVRYGTFSFMKLLTFYKAGIIINSE